MIRGLAPLWMRAIRLEARQRGSHLVRSGAIALTFLMLLGAHLATFGLGAPGLKYFGLIVSFCCGLITSAGAGFFSAVITEEKEAGSLSLLLLADMPPAAILVGKSTTRLAAALLVFAGVLPFVVLAFALGGLTEVQVLAGLLAVSAYLVFTANLGLFCSVLLSTTEAASRLTFLVLVGLLTLSPALQSAAGTLMTVAGRGPGDLDVVCLDRLATAFDRISVWRRLSEVLEPTFSGGLWSWQPAMHVAGAAALFAISLLVFPRTCRFPPTVEATRRISGSTPRARRSWLRRLAAPRPWRNPIVWKDYVLLGGGARGLCLRLFAAPALWGGMHAAKNFLTRSTGMTVRELLTDLLLLFVVVDVLTFAVRFYNSEVRGGTLCTLVMLPRSTAWIGWSKLLGCALSAAPLLLWLLWSLGLLAAESRLPWTWDKNPEIIVLPVCGLTLLAQMTVACSLVVKSGALPIAITALLALSAVLLPYGLVVANTFQPMAGEDVTLVLPALYCTLLASAALQLAIAALVRRAAAQ